MAEAGFSEAGGIVIVRPPNANSKEKP
ncbi:hypothetical protein LCGC14_2854140, partial [marine sediment metagenome]